MAKIAEEKSGSEMSEKLKALEAARLQIEKEFGAGSLMKVGTGTDLGAVDVVPSGSILLDEALGVGGYPRGRIIEMYGPESSGKTTLALHAVAEAQKLHGIAAFIDAEHALDPIYAKNLGVNIDELWVSQPDTGEQALEICENLVRSGAVDIIVIDSVAALVPKAEIQGDMGDSHVGLQARLMSQALRKLTAVISRSNCVVIFINQLREKVGIMFGNPETTTGGRALKFYSSVRMEVRKGEKITQGADVVGNRTKVKIVKNKIAPPFKTAEFDIMYGEGVSRLGTLIDMGVELEIVDKSGAWYSYKEERLGQGRDNVKQYLLDQKAANARILREAGVPAARISVSALCTMERADIFYSHRRMCGARGNMAAFLMRMAMKDPDAEQHFTPDPAWEGYFSDNGSSHHNAVLWLAEQGISQGWDMKDGTFEFRPYANVARADMAAFLHRMYTGGLVPEYS